MDDDKLKAVEPLTFDPARAVPMCFVYDKVSYLQGEHHMEVVPLSVYRRDMKAVVESLYAAIYGEVRPINDLIDLRRRLEEK